MVTARSPLRTRRARPRGVVARLFWLGALLAAVFASHGFSAETGAGHTDPIRITWSTHATTAVDGPRAAQPAQPEQHQEHGEDADHPGGECLSGKPEDGPDAGTDRSVPAVLPAAAEPAPAPVPPRPTAGSSGAAAPELPHRIAHLRV
ncbi:hypothetical protein ACFVUY_11610 [Kitasatospora sp. NPDC058063]|uniref:hypothetical protein n=1 Tax=unclassified Kitasatospora TaxID=2633591 RepID=UPI0036DD6499